MAPFDGVIYDNEAHASLVARVKGFDERLKLELDFLKRNLDLQCQDKIKTITIELETTKKLLQLEIESKEQQKKYLIGQVKSAQVVPWYKAPVFNLIAGFLLCAVISGVSIYGAYKIKE